jgi:hypothetical protein
MTVPLDPVPPALLAPIAHGVCGNCGSQIPAGHFHICPVLPVSAAQLERIERKLDWLHAWFSEPPNSPAWPGDLPPSETEKTQP